MYTDDLGVEIPSFFVSKPSYLALLGEAVAMHPHQVHVRILPTELAASTIFDLFLILILSPVLILTVTYVIVYIRRRRQHRLEIASTDVVESLPTRIYAIEKPKNSDYGATRQGPSNDQQQQDQEQDNDDEGWAPECVVCLDKFMVGDKLTTLPCRHEFHKECM